MRRWPRRRGSPGHGAPETEPGAAAEQARCRAARNRLLPAAAPLAQGRCRHPARPNRDVLGCPWGLRQPRCPTAGPMESPTAGAGGAGGRGGRAHLAYGNQLEQPERSWHQAGKGRPGGSGAGGPGSRGPGRSRFAGEGERGRGQAQIGTVWAIEAPLSGGLWRARQPFRRGRKRRLEPDWPGGPRAGGRKRGREAPPPPRTGSGTALGSPAAPRPPIAPHRPPGPVPSRPLCPPRWHRLRGGGCCWGRPRPRVPEAAPGTSASHSEDARRDVSRLAAWPWWERVCPRPAWHDLRSHRGPGSPPWGGEAAFSGVLGRAAACPPRWAVTAPVRMGLSAFHPGGISAGSRRQEVRRQQKAGGESGQVRTPLPERGRGQHKAGAGTACGEGRWQGGRARRRGAASGARPRGRSLAGPLRPGPGSGGPQA